ncbi:MAG: hypothetical protein WD042_10640 [Phycisphaeraceae bacterium]
MLMHQWMLRGLWLAAVAAILASPLTARAEEAPDARQAKEAKEPKQAKDAKDANAKGEARKPRLMGAYAIMVKELKLSDDQEAKMLAIVAERDAKLKAWQDAHQAELDAAEQAVAQANKGEDKEAQKKANDQLKALRAQRAQISEDVGSAITALLTPEQLAHWRGYSLWTGMMGHFKKAELTDEQKEKAKAIALTYGQQLRDVKEGDRKAANTIRDKAWMQVRDEVLTPEQREKMGGADEKAKKPEKPESPKEDAKAGAAEM